MQQQQQWAHRFSAPCCRHSLITAPGSGATRVPVDWGGQLLCTRLAAGKVISNLWFQADMRYASHTCCKWMYWQNGRGDSIGSGDTCRQRGEELHRWTGCLEREHGSREAKWLSFEFEFWIGCSSQGHSFHSNIGWSPKEMKKATTLFSIASLPTATQNTVVCEPF